MQQETSELLSGLYLLELYYLLIARDWPFGTAIGTVLTVIVVILMVVYARNTKNTDQLVV